MLNPTRTNAAANIVQGNHIAVKEHIQYASAAMPYKRAVKAFWQMYDALHKSTSRQGSGVAVRIDMKPVDMKPIDAHLTEGTVTVWAIPHLWTLEEFP